MSCSDLLYMPCCIGLWYAVLCRGVLCYATPATVCSARVVVMPYVGRYSSVFSVGTLTIIPSVTAVRDKKKRATIRLALMFPADSRLDNVYPTALH